MSNKNDETPGEDEGNERTEFIYSRIADLLDLVQLRYDLESSDAANEIFMTLVSFVGIELPGPFEEPLKGEMEIWHKLNAEFMAEEHEQKRPPLKLLKFERPKKKPEDTE